MVGLKTWTESEERKAVELLEHPVRVKVFDLLMIERLTSRDLSRRLHLNEKLVNYHCRRLIRFGTIEVISIEQRRGTEAKILRPTPLGLYAREWV